MKLSIIILLCIGTYLILFTRGYRFIGITIDSIAAVCFFYLITRQLNGSLIFVIRVIFSCLFVLGIIYFFCVLFVIIYDSRKNNTEQPNYIIVLGASLIDNSPSPSMLDRLEITLTYLQNNPDCTAILTGGKSNVSNISEAQCMYNWLLSENVPNTQLIMEESALNTYENIQYSAQVIGRNDTEIAILTSDYHLHRALFLAKSQNIRVTGISAPTRRLFPKINYFIREVVAMTEIYLFGAKGL